MTETAFGPMVTQKACLLSLLCSYFLFFFSKQWIFKLCTSFLLSILHSKSYDSVKVRFINCFQGAKRKIIKNY